MSRRGRRAATAPATRPNASVEGVWGNREHAMMLDLQTPIPGTKWKEPEEMINVNARAHDGGRTLLYYAAGNNNIEATRWLLNHGANVNIPNDVGDTPLHAASKRNYPQLATMLLNAGADITARNAEGKTALDLSNDPEMRRLLETAERVSGRSRSAPTVEAEPQAEAGTGGRAAGGRGRKKKKVSFQLPDSSQEREAARRLILTALEEGEVNKKYTHQRRPLHLAVKHNFPDLVRQLLNKGALIYAGDRYKQTPLRMAEALGNDEIKGLLEEESSRRRYAEFIPRAQEDVMFDEMMAEAVEHERAEAQQRVAAAQRKGEEIEQRAEAEREQQEADAVAARQRAETAPSEKLTRRDRRRQTATTANERWQRAYPMDTVVGSGERTSIPAPQPPAARPPAPAAGAGAGTGRATAAPTTRRTTRPLPPPPPGAPPPLQPGPRYEAGGTQPPAARPPAPAAGAGAQPPSASPAPRSGGEEVTLDELQKLVSDKSNYVPKSKQSVVKGRIAEIGNKFRQYINQEIEHGRDEGLSERIERLLAPVARRYTQHKADIRQVVDYATKQEHLAEQQEQLEPRSQVPTQLNREPIENGRQLAEMLEERLGQAHVNRIHAQIRLPNVQDTFNLLRDQLVNDELRRNNNRGLSDEIIDEIAAITPQNLATKKEELQQNFDSLNSGRGREIEMEAARPPSPAAGAGEERPAPVAAGRGGVEEGNEFGNLSDEDVAAQRRALAEFEAQRSRQERQADSPPNVTANITEQISQDLAAEDFEHAKNEVATKIVQGVGAYKDIDEDIKDVIIDMITQINQDNNKVQALNDLREMLGEAQKAGRDVRAAGAARDGGGARAIPTRVPSPKGSRSR